MTTPTPQELDELTLLRAIIAESPVVVYAKDTALRFVLSNREHARLVQLPSEEIVGRTDRDLFGDEAGPVDEASHSVLKTGAASVGEFPLTLPEGERVFYETLFRLCDERGQPIGIGGIATDITRRIELEHEVRAKNARLEATLEELQATRAVAREAERMASLGNLVAGLGHEVNTPLSVAGLTMSVAAEEVRKLSEDLQTRGRISDPTAAGLAKILESIDLAEQQLGRITKLMSSFREVAVDRAQVEVRTTSLTGWLEVAAQTLIPLCRQHGVQLSWKVEGDRTMRLAVGALHQIATNLVVNACVHAFEGKEGPREVSITFCGKEDGLQLRVDDNGRGISAPVAARLFEPFFTTRRGSGGTGLGLHIVYNMSVGTLGGSVHHEARPGGGSSFVVKIPYGTDTTSLLEEERVRVKLNPDLPLALWAAFAADLRSRATTLRRTREAEERTRIYGQLIGSLGIYGLTALAESVQMAHGAPGSAEQAHKVCKSLDAHAAAIEEQLRSLACPPDYGQASST